MKFKRKHEVLINKLQDLCPIAFPKKPLPKVPLALRSTRTVQKMLDVNYVTAEYLLKLWCQGKRYDKACSIVGAPRYRLDGSVSGKVSAGQAEFHKARLDEYYRSRAVGEAKHHNGNLTEYYAAKFKPKSIMDMLRNTIGVLWKTKEE